jgi:hypothetical protein
MRIEPSGVVMIGVCEIQTPKCRAKEPSAITAVWTLPGRSQVNVCRECMEEMVRAGEWEMLQSRITPHVDVAVLNQDSKIVLMIEVKKRPYYDEDLLGFAVRVHRNLIVHSGIPSQVFFMLALFPSPFYLWSPESALIPTARPDFMVNCEAEMLHRRKMIAEEPSEAHSITEEVIADWIRDILSHPPDRNSQGMDWLHNSGLLERITNGTVVRELEP